MQHRRERITMIDNWPLHKDITPERIIDAVEREMSTLDNPGFCMACGEEVDGCEPDARGYDCELCETTGSVYGAAEILIHL